MITIFEKNLAQELGLSYERCKIKSITPVEINFRCPLCGDSARNKSMTRGWFYEYENKLRFGCFNCNENYSFSDYIKRYHPEKFRIWLRERRGQVDLDEGKQKEMFSVKPIVVDTLPFCDRLDLLPDAHPAKKYMIDRKILSDKMSVFYFTMQWKDVANHVSPGTYENTEELEPRIVIPIRNKEGKIESIQGRALRKSEAIRYLTIKTHEHANKVFGIDRVQDDGKPVFYFEGPIDSTFIHNGVSITGGQMDVNIAPFKDRRVWVLDNENRSPDTMSRYEKLINAGEEVVLWDKAPWHSKDVNDMIQKENASPEAVYDYLINNIVTGLNANIRFTRWKKNDRKNQTNSKSKRPETDTPNLRDRLQRRNRSSRMS
ncbi:MAG: hypothetical protein [Caudoviricetes sp.]|nr:MAG: hypothetical protein [Caudoviricetes sp.]